MTDFNNYYLLRHLSFIEGLGLNRINNIVQHFPDLSEIKSATTKEISRIEGISDFLAVKIKNYDFGNTEKNRLIENDLSRLLKINARIISITDSNFPERLKNIYSPPLNLYILGGLRETDITNIAVVGTRNCTYYGKKCAEMFTEVLVKNNVTITSGMARGIDTIAHKTALSLGGRTIAVIGSGIDVIYPKENKELFYQIVDNGAVISEFEPGTKPDAVNFPRRNRLISALSQGVLIIETGIKGGAMQTATIAIDQGKEVYAVPGEINKPYSEGNNFLIQQGNAKLVTKPDDILEDMKAVISFKIPQEKIKKEELTIFEQKLFELINDDPKHVDDISMQAGISASDTLVNLLMLEFKGYIRQLPGKYFILN